MQHCRFKIHNGDPGHVPKAPARPKRRRSPGSCDSSTTSRMARGCITARPSRWSRAPRSMTAASSSASSSRRKSTETPFLLDPMRIDAARTASSRCFPSCAPMERGVTYIPVRLEETTLVKPNAVPERALIEIISKNERSIVANSFIFNGKDELIAVLRGVRCQAISTRRASSRRSGQLSSSCRARSTARFSVRPVSCGKASDIAAAAASLGLSQNRRNSDRIRDADRRLGDCSRI